MSNHPEPAKYHLRVLRRSVATLGVLALIGLGLVGHSTLRVPLTALAALAILFAALLVLLETYLTRKAPHNGIETFHTRDPSCRLSTSYWSLATVESRNTTRRWPGWSALMTVLFITIGASQTWFVSGTAIAGGDVTPPIGTAWISRLFEPWVWTGGNLGGPNVIAVDLPWAVVDFLVHAMGGSGALAQRIWLSGLFVGAALACYWLLRVLDLSPIAAAAGALVWVFNPYVVADVSVNDVYLAAMVLVALWPAIVIQVARGRWRLGWALLTFLATAPLAGFVYSNPPLLGLALAGVFVAALFTAFLGRRDVARRAGIALAGGFSVLAGASAFWIVPSLQALKNVAPTLASTSSWAWTEGRVAIANGFWLNTVWGWSHPRYYPYAYLYNTFPFSLVKYLLPAIAFSALALIGQLDSTHRRRRAQLASLAALTSLFLIFFGTGTVPPGSLIFDPIYHLPLGWLLQDPGRFLMAAALGYAAMAAVALEIVVETLVSWGRDRTTRHSAATTRSPHSAPKWLTTLGPTTAVAAVALVGAFPMAAGTLVPGFKHDIPYTHVTIPKYWTQLATQMNKRWPRATVVVLPPNDFYQMPYTWYYGDDTFITNLLSAHVIDPSSAGYIPSSKELLRAVDQLAGALLQHRWQEATDIMGALGATQMLVRGDISARYKGTNIVPPVDLIRSLAHDPQAELVAHAGPLRLFAISPRYKLRPESLVTVNATNPDLAVLADLPPGSALVTRPLEPGKPSVLQTPPLSSWKIVGKELEINQDEPAGWRYTLATLPALAPNARTLPLFPPPRASILSSRALPGGAKSINIGIPIGSRLIHDGSFSKGLWGPVGNCYALPGTIRGADLHAEIVADAGPSGAPALQLSARSDRACEAQTLSWRTGPLLVSLWYRTVTGGKASLCVWQVGPNSCATGLPALRAASGWHHVSFSILPLPRTKRIILFLYATPTAFGTLAIDQYADVSAFKLLQDGQPVLIGFPTHRSTDPSTLLVNKDGFSPSWATNGASQHVLVDGLRNGSIISGNHSLTPGTRFTYLPTSIIRDADIISLLTVVLVAIGLLSQGLAWWSQAATSKRRALRHSTYNSTVS